MMNTPDDNILVCYTGRKVYLLGVHIVQGRKFHLFHGWI